MSSPKLVLAVIDGMAPAAVQRAMAAGRAPVLSRIAERGAFVSECCAMFPSVTPVCAASITTGVRPDVHRIPAMNWFSRDEDRYVEYGSSFAAARRFGIAQQLNDTVYNMNLEHLPADVPTVFESLDDAGFRTAGTTYLFYRGRHKHEIAKESPLGRLAGAVMRKPTMGPKELFYADLFASRKTGCRGQLGKPGLRDQHSGCVGAYLAEHDLFDFLLFSLPDNDFHSHEHGPEEQVTSIAEADRQLERLMHAGGGVERFLDEHAVIAVADHSHNLVTERVELFGAFGEDWAVAGPGGVRRSRAEVAVCPSQRSAQVYALLPEGRAEVVPRIVATALGIEGVDLVMHRPAPREGAIATARDGGAPAVLRFAPGGDVRDARGARWSLDGDLSVLRATVAGGELLTPDYPDALARVWAALSCETSGDVLLSAAPGWEFPDWGGVAHTGGGSHGSLHACDSLGALLYCGLEPPAAQAAGAPWSIADITPAVLAHFGVG